MNIVLLKQHLRVLRIHSIPTIQSQPNYVPGNTGDDSTLGLTDLNAAITDFNSAKIDLDGLFNNMINDLVLSANEIELDAQTDIVTAKTSAMTTEQGNFNTAKWFTNRN